MVKKSVPKAVKDLAIERVLVENFVALQKVMVNLSNKFDTLSDKISKLLDIFEISAKAMADKNFELADKTNNKELLEKLEKILEQNRVIARGVSMIHEMPQKEAREIQPLPVNKPTPVQPLSEYTLSKTPTTREIENPGYVKSPAPVKKEGF